MLPKNKLKVGDKVTCIQPISLVHSEFNLKPNKIFTIKEIISLEIVLNNKKDIKYSSHRFLKVNDPKYTKFLDKLKDLD